ncbi:MAG: hypothetical protein GX754_10625 [Clostridiaceae bacterium]|nr:hypothetical protein [Clostridiaceae bacterium]
MTIAIFPLVPALPGDAAFNAASNYALVTNSLNNHPGRWEYNGEVWFFASIYHLKFCAMNKLKKLDKGAATRFKGAGTREAD